MRTVNESTSYVDCYDNTDKVLQIKPALKSLSVGNAEYLSHYVPLNVPTGPALLIHTTPCGA